jgi:hypothetical protein
VDRDAADAAVAPFDLAGMQALPELEPDAAHLVPERGRAADATAGTVEGGQDPVAGRLDQPAPGLLHQVGGQLVVVVQQLTPAPAP